MDRTRGWEGRERDRQRKREREREKIPKGQEGHVIWDSVSRKESWR